MGAALLLVQLVVILLTARALAWVLRWFGQPPVIGEMIAGLALGPLVFGAIAPDTQAALFTKASLPALQSLSTLGLVLFMFVVGAELRMPGGARRQLGHATRVGVLAVALPMLLGVAAAPALYPRFAPEGVAFWPFALFLATAVAITALPVMARILKERQLTQSEPGRLALASAAVADALAWVALAMVVALISAHGNWVPFWQTLGGMLGLAALCFGLFRPLLTRMLARHAADGRPHGGTLVVLLVGALACAAATEWLNLHAVFGAFLFGACLPRDDRLLATLTERIEHVAVLLLLPVFFALAGLNTSRDAFAGGAGLALLLILLVAIAGKVLGGMAGARWAGQSWRDSFAIGSLMNARGLMELIVIRVGLDAGVIGQEMFTMLLVMAIVTTVMTTPMLMWFMKRRPTEAQATRRQERIAGS
ncbi:Kef-type K+ transport system membrane component KefB [Luteibacter sp. Sphag1AF]|uniref:cation:proton antiporter n=1 Tax=Luteibacter sp. Sphag1AF TaxID=2587031 RepID=UPI00161FE489|nr:cation:proton antiporter [Luteibacter sp. Sphag1AF]MBB3226367.1 Kef-type K+ transport system membrane component KefB [Luteibacter sp. Sphag1AF]